VANSDEVETSLTLLRALKADPRNAGAWGTFLGRYRALLEDWCRRCGLDRGDMEDALGELFLKLLDEDWIRRFDLTRRFRPWLYRIVQNALADYRRRRRRLRDCGRGGPDTCAPLDRAEDAEGLASAVLEGFQEDLEEAERIREAVKAKVLDSTWRAYELLAMEGLPAREVAARLGIEKVGSVYQARYSVAKLLRAEGEKVRAARAARREGHHG
jgi:RNA polymerase sigma-70 factor (ECF subfamily)